MTDFLWAQLDYIYFTYGLAFALLAAVARSLALADTTWGRPWNRLALFALARAVAEWAGVCRVSFPEATLLEPLTFGLGIAAYAALLDFARLAVAPNRAPRSGMLVGSVAAVLALLGLVGGYDALHHSVRYLFGVPASAWAAWRLWESAGRAERGSCLGLRVASMSLAAMALFTALFFPPAVAAPGIAAAVDLLRRVALPVQVLRALAATVLGLGVWAHYCALQRSSVQAAAVRWVRFERAITLALVAVLSVGWLTTESLGLSEERHAHEALETRARTIAAMIPASVVSGLDEAANEARARTSRETAALLDGVIRDQADVRVLLLVAVRGNSLTYVRESLASAERGRKAASPGDPYLEPNANVVRVLVSESRAVTFPSSHAGTAELVALAPTRDPTSGQVVALAGFHVSREQVRQQVARTRLPPILTTLLACWVLIGFFVTERRRSEWTVRIAESERRYRHLVESSPNSVIMLDAGNRVIAVNPKGAELLGIPRKHLLGAALPSLWPPAEQAVIADVLWRARLSGTVAVTADFKRPDGMVIALESVFTRASGPDERDALLVGVSNDVTERQRARLALERRNRFTELILGCSSRFLSLRNEDVDQAIHQALRDLGRFLAVDRAQLFTLHEDNRAFSLTHEWCAPGIDSRVQDLQATSTDRYPWLWPTLETHGFVTAADVQMLPVAAATERESLLAQGVQSFACVAVQREGRVVGFLGLDALRDRRGWPADELGLVRVMADVLASALARRRVEEALRDREEVFRSISDAAHDGIVMIDHEGRISVWNDAAERMFGYSQAEAVGQDAHLLLAPDQYRDASRTGFAAFRETGAGPILGTAQQMVGRRKGGSLFPVEVTASPIRLRGRWHAVGIVRDITERLKIEEALWKAKEETDAANAELRRAVATAERLAQEAAAANATKSDFLANMSHEIRTPMNGILGMTGLLLDSDLEGEQRDYAETVSSCAESLLTIINDILDFSKVEAGKLDLELLDFDLDATLEDATDILAVRAHQKGLELTCSVAPQTPVRLQGDPGRLRQVLTNLVGNAIKFTAVGEVAISVEPVEERDDSVTLRFSVRDTGPGIPADKLDLLFQPFTQVDSSTTRRFGGTGLGLSISRRLAELMGGQIGVESEPGRGSTFWFTARFRRQLASDARVLPEVDIAGLRILVVDDNETNRRVLEGMLAAWGCRTGLASGSDEAMSRLHEGVRAGDPFGVVVLDMLMPDVSGDELGRQILADPVLGAPRLLMMTSVGRRGDVTRLQELGFSAYLTKPVKGSHLREALRSIAGGTLPGPEAPRILTRHTLREAQRRKRRILLAEDNITNQKVALKLLERLGHRVDAVANGLEALRALRDRPYDLVLMDVQMPEMDGLEATRLIREGGFGVRNPRIPIIAMTAHAMKGDRERCLEAGMDDYVSKPIQPDALVAALGRWEGHAETPAREAAAAPEPQPYQPPAEEAESTPFTRESLLDRLGGDEEVFAEIVQIFLEDLPGLLQQMDSALTSGDTATLRRHAHSLKGSSGTVGATRLQALSLALEQAAARGDLAAAAERLPPVQAESAEVAVTMGGWLATGEVR